MNKQLSAWPAAVAAIVATGGTAAAQAGEYRGGYHGHMWGDGYGFMGFGMMFLFWGIIIVLVVLAVRWFLDREGASKKQSDALETLRQRLARGEIDVAEFEERRKALES